MSSIFADDSDFIQLDFFSELPEQPQMSENIEILQVINGELLLQTGGGEKKLSAGDFVLINANTVYELRGGAAIYARLSLAANRIYNLLGKSSVRFQCGPENWEEPAYLRLEALLWRIYEAALHKDQSGSIQIISQYYQMIELLSTAFPVEKEGGSTQAEEERDNQILQFIRSYYAEPITLGQLARSLFLSEAYLSKYIKKRFKMNYMELVNAVRLSHAVETLKHSNESITRIALSNGFSSVASFNKIFKSNYGLVPSDYRKAYLSSNEVQRDTRCHELTPAVRAAVEAGIEDFKAREKEDLSAVRIEATVDALSRNTRPVTRSWQKVINAGTAYDLTRSDYQQQLLYLKDRLGIEYVRFWDVFSPELRINIHPGTESANFSTLFLIIDFLIDHGMKPFLELAFKPIRILKNPNKAVIDKHRSDFFSDAAELNAFMRELAQQLVSRYGRREVSSWYFEYWKIDPRLYYVDQKLMRTFTVSNEKYFEEFDALCAGIKGVLPEAQIGGGGFTYRTYGDAGMAEIFETWKQHSLPDFVSLNCYQYTNAEGEDGESFERRYGDMSFIIKSLEDTRRIMREVHFPDRPVYVTEFDFTVSNRSVANDSCNKAAQLMQELLMTMGHTEVLSYWTALDAYAEYTDTSAVVFGGVGLLSKDGIPKPAFYTYAFLRRMDGEILQQTDEYMITRQGMDSFKVLCHNFRGYSDGFYEGNEDEIAIRDFASFTRDNREKHLRLRLTNVPNGNYQIRIREVDSQSGSVQSAWQRLNYDTHLDRDDVAFLRNQCVPAMWRMEQEVVNGVLDFEIRLAPNSIKYTHFILRKG